MRHFNNYRISGLFLCLLAMGSMNYAHAQQVDSRTALDIAANYLAQERGNRAPVRGNELEIAYTAQEASETYYYAINYGTDDGFVIVSGHEDVQEVLGYADTGHFDYDSIAPGLRYMLGSYQEQIHALYTDPALANEHRAGRRNATAARSNIANFVSLTWNQYAPYNFGITGGKNSYPIGCVNTATSMVMKYYNHPAQATNPAMGSYSLGTVTARSVEANRTLNFSAMTNSYSSSTTSYSGANKAVADLMYLVARLNDTDFDIDGSGAWEYTSAENMMDYLDYDKTMEYVERDKFSSTDWDNMMYAEMSAKRPVIYTGRDADRNVGHAFLLTGYKDSKYYINWGWGGSSNGYFALSACNVNNRKYNQAQTALTHIKKDAGGNPSISISSYSVENTDLRLGQTFYTKINYEANTIKRSIYSWQVKLKNVNTGAITALHITENCTMKGASYLADLSKYTNLTDTIPTTFVPGDQYEMLLYYKQGNGSWQEVAQSTKPVITIKHQIDFKSYALNNTDLSYGSKPNLVVTYNKYSIGSSIGYDLCAKVTNMTQGTDTLELLKSEFKPSSIWSNDQTTSNQILISGLYRVGDKIKIEAGYRISGTSTWEYINQEPIELTLAPEMEMRSSSVNDSGDLTFGYKLHYEVEYICRSSLSMTYELGMRYKGIDNPLDTVYCFNTWFNGYVNSTYNTGTTGLPSFLKLNKSYRLEVKYRVKGESNWQDFDDATTADIRVIPAVTFHSFDHPSTEKYACTSDTLSFVYSKVSSSNSLSYKIGAHLIGQSSGVDTTVVTRVDRYSTFSGSTGDNQTAMATFSLPSTLRVGEQVKVQLCWQEPGEAWIPMVNEYKTFKILDCYELQKCWADADTACISESCTIKVDYRSLTTSSKPTYYLGVRLHNKTTGVTEEVIETSYSLSSSASTTETSTKEVSFIMPGHYDVEDQVEVTAMYRVDHDEEWKEVPGQPVTFAMKAPKLGYSLVGKPTVTNDGYITPKNFEIHLPIKNYQKQELKLYFDLDIYYNGSYQSSYVRRYITLAPETTTEVVLTAENCSTISLSRLISGRDYTFRVYTSTGYISKVSDSPILHLVAYGDVTMDGNNDGEDIEAMKEHLLDPIAHPFGIASQVAADMNVDGKVTIGDMTLIIKSQQVQQ